MFTNNEWKKLLEHSQEYIKMERIKRLSTDLNIHVEY